MKRAVCGGRLARAPASSHSQEPKTIYPYLFMIPLRSSREGKVEEQPKVVLIHRVGNSYYLPRSGFFGQAGIQVPLQV
jgi:hypothetical protein